MSGSEVEAPLMVITETPCGAAATLAKPRKPIAFTSPATAAKAGDNDNNYIDTHTHC